MRMPPPTPPPPERVVRRRFAPRVALIVAAVIIVVLIASARQLAVLYTDKLWFGDIGFGDTWRTLLVARIVPAVIFTVAMFVILFVSLVVADRLAPRFRNMGPEDEIVERYRTFVAPYASRVRVIVATVFALLVGVGASSQWREWILFRNRVSWGVKDPQFGKDIGFYVFELPFLRFVAQWLFVVFLVTFLVTGVFHYLNGGIRFQAPYQHVTPQVKAHLSVILAVMAVTKTAQYWLGRYQLVFSHRGIVDGATNTDVKAQLPALEFLVLISIVAAALFVVNIWQRGWTLPLIAVGLWAFISIVLGTAYPAYVQNFQVKPNEFQKEQKYIQRNIDATRTAFGLDRITTSRYDYSPLLSRTALSTPASEATLKNTRKWDETIAQGPLTALQEFAGFYKFSTPQTDRYTIGDQAGQQVYIAARNVDLKNLPNNTWTNRHLVYTHGYAFNAVVANATNNDRPSFALSNIPPQGDLAIGPTPPNYRLYFGAGVSDFALGNSKQGELELTSGTGQSQTTSYQGRRGVELSSFVRKAAFAMRFSDLNLLLSDQITSQTRLLYVRDVTDRVKKAAPFLRFDSSPYLVAQQDGRLVWVVDGYTVTNRYPYSQAIGGGDVENVPGLGSGYNYVRNSVKATVDAYDGTVRFYAVDPTDPMLKAYRKAFPDLFSDAASMPPDLGAHFRYPQELFKVQARQFELYHLTKPQDFYNGVDQWVVAPAPSGTTTAPAGTSAATTTVPPAGNNGGRKARLRNATNRMQPLYQTLQRPDGTGQELVLTIQYVPVSKSDEKDTQLTSFLMATNDGYRPDGTGGYGQLRLYDIAQDNAISPVQAARQIEQDTTISQRFSLLRQGGSNVQLGAVQMLPMAGSIVYMRTVFIQAVAENSFPLLKNVLLVGPDPSRNNDQKAVIADTVDQAVDALFGVKAPTGTGTNGGGGGGGNANPTDAAGILRRLAQAWKDYNAALAKGDFATAGKKQDEIKNLFAQAERLGLVTAGPPAPGPGSAPTTTTATTTTTSATAPSVPTTTVPASPTTANA